jgi:hypothetical protein
MHKPILTILFLTLLILPLGAEDKDIKKVKFPNATDLVKAADELLRGAISSVQEADFIVIRPDRKILRTFLVYLKGTNLSLAQFLAPLRDKNITNLKRKYDLWLHTPKIRKTIRIPATMMHEGFMGSDFTYDDIVKATTLTHGYFHKIIGVSKKYEKKFGTVYVVDLKPRPEMPIAYPKLRLWIKAEGTILLRQAYYAQNPKTKKLFVQRIVVFDDIKELGGRTFGTRQTMVVMEKKGYRTIFHTKKAEYDKGIEDSVFNMRSLTSPPKPKW